MPFGPSLLGLPRLSLSFFFLPPRCSADPIEQTSHSSECAHHMWTSTLLSAPPTAFSRLAVLWQGEFHSDLLHCLCQMLSAQYHCCCTYVCNLSSSSLHRPCRISVVAAGAIRQHRVQEWPCWLFFRGSIIDRKIVH